MPEEGTVALAQGGLEPRTGRPGLPGTLDRASATAKVRTKRQEMGGGRKKCIIIAKLTMDQNTFEFGTLNGELR